MKRMYSWRWSTLEHHRDEGEIRHKKSILEKTKQSKMMGLVERAWFNAQGDILYVNFRNGSPKFDETIILSKCVVDPTGTIDSKRVLERMIFERALADLGDGKSTIDTLHDVNKEFIDFGLPTIPELLLFRHSNMLKIRHPVIINSMATMIRVYN